MTTRVEALPTLENASELRGRIGRLTWVERIVAGHRDDARLGLIADVSSIDAVIAVERLAIEQVMVLCGCSERRVR